MPDFNAKMHQNRFRLWVSLQRSPDSLAGFKGTYSKRRGEKGRGGETRGEEGRGGKRRGEEERGEERRGGEGWSPPPFVKS